MNSERIEVRIKNILCPTDFSGEWEDEVRFAARAASLFAAKLFVCHQKSQLWWKSELGEAANVALLNERIERILNADEKIKSPEWETVILESESSAAKCIASFAYEMFCDLIILGARHHLLIAPFFGSTIEKIVRRAPCPVLILPAGFSNRQNFSAPGGFQKILMNYDFTHSADSLLDYAAALARACEAELHLLYVLPRSENAGIELSETPEGNELARKLALENLRRAARKTEAGLKMVCAVRQGAMRSEVALYTAEENIDLICTVAPEEKFYFEYVFPVWLRLSLGGALRPLMVAPQRARLYDDAFYLKTIGQRFQSASIN